MEERQLYGDKKLIEELLPGLALVEASEGGWATVYRDAATGRFWLKYHTVAGAQGGGYLMLVRLPAPATEELIQISIHSPHTDEAVAAVLRLLDEEEVEKKNFRHLVILQIEQQLQVSVSEQEKERLLQVIRLAGLDDPMNRREVSGKSMQEIEQDAAYFSGIAARARQALDALQ